MAALTSCKNALDICISGNSVSDSRLRCNFVCKVYEYFYSKANFLI